MSDLPDRRLHADRRDAPKALEKEEDPRVDHSQYDPPSARPLATAADYQQPPTIAALRGEIAELEASLAALRQAVSRDGLTGEALVALARAHREDSETIDRQLSHQVALDAVIAEIRQWEEVLRSGSSHFPSARGMKSLADRLAAIKV